MKLVAIKNFTNVKSLDLDPKDAGLQHPLHIHKGCRFAVGKSEVFKELNETDKGIVTQLFSSGSAVVDCDANKEIVARIDSEVKLEERASKATAVKAAAPA
jgi:hypothetical protein